MKIYIYSFFLLFSLGAIIVEVTNGLKSFKLIEYSFSPDSYFFKDKLYFTKRLSGDNSSGSQGTFIYFGIVESSKKKGNVRGWINTMEDKWIFDIEKNNYYFNIWYCPRLNVILSLADNETSYNDLLVQSWFRIIISILVLPLSIKIYLIKKRQKLNRANL